MSNRPSSQTSELINDTHNFGVLIKTREVFLSSNLDCAYEEACIDHWAANRFIRNLQILNSISQTPILIHMITCGGVWEYGMAIYDAIKQSASDTIILAYAHARSMSSIILQAATWRVFMPNSYFLIHCGTWAPQNDNWTSAITEADWTKKQHERMLELYVEKCKDGHFWKREGLDQNGIKQWIQDQINRKQEVYMTAREAVDRGFADAVLGDEDFENIAALRNDV